MIYDPVDQNICMNEVGVLFCLRANPQGDEHDWVELNEMRRNGEFRRPEW